MGTLTVLSKDRGLLLAAALISAVAVVLSMMSVLAVPAGAATPTWVQLTPTTSPSAREFPAMAYDASMKQTVLFGGFDGTSADSDTWAFDGSTWTKLNPATSPPARSEAAMVYDAAANDLVMFGGLSSGASLGDTWIFNGTDWIQPTFSGGTPAPREDASLAYDAASDEVILFGGMSNGPKYYSDTWALDVSTSTWTQLSPGSSPPARSDAAMTYDPGKSEEVLFGGGTGSGSLSDTWTFNAASDTWSQVSGSAPPARQDAGMAYDAAFGGDVLFGGTGASFYNDTWAFNGTSWSQVSTAQSPSARYGFGMTYDGNLNEVVVFGGNNSQLLEDSYALTDAAVPGPPGTPVAAAAGSGQVSLSWTAPSDTGGAPITSYVVTPSPPCPSCSGLAPTGTSTNVSGLTNGTSYTFTVAAINAAGTGTASAASNSVAPIGPPTVTGVSPSSGPTSGGTSITITGTNFYTAAGQTTFAVGPNSATNVSCSSSTTCTATTPAGSGTQDVVATTPSGSSPTSSADEFTYDSLPVITSVAPNTGPIGGGTTVTVNGSGFNPPLFFKFGNTLGTNPQCFGSTTSCTVESPASPAGSVDVTITTPGGTSATNPGDQFTYLAGPTVTEVSPQAGSSAGGTTITVTGTNFYTDGTTTVKVGSNSATNVSCTSSTTCTATTPAGAGLVDVVVTTPSGTSPASSADQFAYVSPTGRYYPINPCRVLDTRSGLGAPKAPIGPNSSIDLQITGAVQGACSNEVPADATAVVMNVTEADATSGSYLTVWPQGATQPTASNLNFSPGSVVPNLVEVGLSSSGKVSIYNDLGYTDVVADIQGYVGPATSSSSTTGQFNPISPTRILDTRTPLGGHNFPLGTGQTMALQVTGAQGVIPVSGVSAVVLNVTVTDTTQPSFLTLWPAGQTQPTASNLNFSPGQTVPNRVTVPVGASGEVSIYNQQGSTNVIADVAGWYTDGTDPLATGDHFNPASVPVRILDTRNGTGHQGAIGPNSSINLSATQSPSPVPADADAVVANFTVTDTTASSYLSVYPGDQFSVPVVSDLNWPPAATIANLAITKLGAQSLNIYNNSGSTNVIADVEGWYSP